MEYVAAILRGLKPDALTRSNGEFPFLLILISEGNSPNITT